MAKLMPVLWRRQVLLFCILIILLFPTSDPHASGPYDIGQTVVVISNLERSWSRLYHDWIQREWSEVDLIIYPNNLEHFVQFIEKIGNKKHIQKLIFFGHGSPDSQTIFFMNNQPHLTARDFIRIKRDYPNLPQFFTTNAQIQFFNCKIGQNQRLLKAVGDAFLSINGGMVSAYKDIVKFSIARDNLGRKYIDRIVSSQNGWAYHRVKSMELSKTKCDDPNSREYHSENCKWQRDLGRAYKNIAR